MKQKGDLLQVALLGNPIIRTKAEEVKNIKKKEIQKLIDDMIATVMDVDGVGIAAPQVYKPLRIFILASHPNPRYPNAPKMKPTAIINPVFKKCSDEKDKDWEGCLSIPGVRALVPRSKQIEVEYSDRKGKKITTAYSGFVARIFQHEYDHLDGIVFLDRLDSTKDIYMEKEFQKIIASKKL
jgi:peptide deformylase